MRNATKKLYFDDPYQIEFNSKVIKKFSHNNQPALILEQTCFYPESGGQPSDKGTIDEIDVNSVFEEDGRIIHILDQDVDSDEIHGKVDWETRFDHMQQHAGQHILSQSFYELTNAETVSFHLGEKYSTVEIEVRTISPKEVEAVEYLANRVVSENRQIKPFFLSEDKIARVPLRKPPKKSGRIRVIEVSGFDYSACGGTHPKRTGEIGIIKILKQERIRNNIRFEFVCGNRALRDYIANNRILHQVAARLSVNEREIPQTVEKIFDDLKNLKKENKKVQQTIARLEAREIIREAKDQFIHRIFTDKSVEEMRLLALNITKTPGRMAFLGLKKDKKAHVVLACSDDWDIDLRELVPIVADLIKGRGGGRPAFIEIAGDYPQNLAAAADKAKSILAKRMS